MYFIRNIVAFTSDEIPCEENNPCRNGGNCSGTILNHLCSCTNGYTGDNCESNLDISFLLLQFFSSPIIMFFTRNYKYVENMYLSKLNVLFVKWICCVFLPIFPMSDEIVCDQNNPCQNGGACSGTILNYQCSCTGGYTGTNCESMCQ